MSEEEVRISGDTTERDRSSDEGQNETGNQVERQSSVPKWHQDDGYEISLADEELNSDGEPEARSSFDRDISPIYRPPAGVSRHLRKISTAPIELPALEEDEEELRQIQDEGEATRLSRSGHGKSEEKDEIPLSVLPHEDHEFLGLVEEVPLEKSKKKKTKGKARKRPPTVNYETATEIIRLPRVDAQYFGEGRFSSHLPEELEGIVWHRVNYLFFFICIDFMGCRWRKMISNSLWDGSMKCWIAFLHSVWDWFGFHSWSSFRC